MRHARLAITLCVAVGILASCGHRDSVGPGATVDLAAFLIDGASDDDITAVQGLLQVLGEGTEVGLIDGVQGFTTDFANRVLYVDFAPGTSDERMAEIELLLLDERVDRVVRDHTIPE